MYGKRRIRSQEGQCTVSVDLRSELQVCYALIDLVERRRLVFDGRRAEGCPMTTESDKGRVCKSEIDPMDWLVTKAILDT